MLDAHKTAIDIRGSYVLISRRGQTPGVVGFFHTMVCQSLNATEPVFSTL